MRLMLTLIFGNNHNLEEWEQVHTEIGLENEKIHNRGKLSSQAISVVWQKIIQIWNWEMMKSVCVIWTLFFSPVSCTCTVLHIIIIMESVCLR